MMDPTSVRALNTTRSPLQVLETLSTPASPAAAASLRAAAETLVLKANATRWLDSALLPKVLGVLRSLHSSSSPKLAVEVCAAAAAVVSHLLEAAESRQRRRRVKDAVLADEEACSALLRWGITHPEAAKPLPPAQVPHLPASAHYEARALDHAQQQQQQQQRGGFWTPFAVCMSTLVLLLDPGNGGWGQWDDGGPAPARPGACFNAAITAAVVRRALQLAAEHPCRAPLHQHVLLPSPALLTTQPAPKLWPDVPHMCCPGDKTASELHQRDDHITCSLRQCAVGYHVLNMSTPHG